MIHSNVDSRSSVRNSVRDSVSSNQIKRLSYKAKEENAAVNSESSVRKSVTDNVSSNHIKRLSNEVKEENPLNNASQNALEGKEHISNDLIDHDRENESDIRSKSDQNELEKVEGEQGLLDEVIKQEIYNTFDRELSCEETTNENLEDTKKLNLEDDEDISETDALSLRKTQEVQSEPFLDVADSNSLDDSISSENMDEISDPQVKSDNEQIKITIFLPNNFSFTGSYLPSMNICELKNAIAVLIDIEPEKMHLSLMGNTSGEYLSDWSLLLSIPPNTVGGLVLNLTFKYDIEVKNIIKFPSEGTYSPIIFMRQVIVKNNSGKDKIVTVVIEDISYVKEWLGGFKNTKTGQMYHNASTETRFWGKKRKCHLPAEIHYTRTSQTHLPYTTKFTQVDANKATQMWRPDHYIQNVSDKVLTAKPYVEYDQLPEHQVLLDSVIKIQRWYRRLVNRRIQREAFVHLIDLMKEQKKKKTAAEADLNAKRIEYIVGICFPTRRGNFFHFHSIIGLWWKNEYAKLSKIKNIAERRAAYEYLMRIEVSLISALDKQKIKSKVEALQRRDLKLVEETARPIIRHQRKRNMTIVETLEVQRARELKEVYMTYSRNDLDKKERIQVLLSLINSVEAYEDTDCTKDLLSLMRREIDLINIGLEPEYLNGLKKRIQEGILRLVRNPNFNPQVKNFRPIHYPRVDQRAFRCKGCGKLKNPCDSPIHVRLKCYKNCRACDWLEITSYKVLNISPYELILNLLRAKEITKCPRSTYCFALQPFGAHFIINTVWNGKSALSEAMNLPELRLCRWDNKIGWSPWNTILLTVAEAEVHERIYDNSEVYEDDFIQSVKLKHITAKFQFKVMDETEIYCQETGLWDSANDENLYQHIYHRREALEPVDPIFKPPIPKAFLSLKHVKKREPCPPS